MGEENAITLFQKDLPAKAEVVAAMIGAIEQSPLLDALQRELDVLVLAIDKDSNPEIYDVNQYNGQVDIIVSGLLQSIAAFKKNIKDAMGPITDITHAMHKVCTTTTKAMIDKIDDSELRMVLIAYRYKIVADRKAEAQRLRQEAKEKAEAENKRLQDIEDARVAAEKKRIENETIQRAEQLIAEGKLTDADKLLSEKIHVPTHMIQMQPVAPVMISPSVLPKTAVSMVKKAKAVVTSKADVIDYVAANHEWLGLVDVTDTQLRAYTKQFRDGGISPVKGIEFVDDGGLRIRGYNA
jgi:hypothetical protein